MKHLLLITILAISSLNLIEAQCIPDVSITQAGIYPDSATGLVAGTVNQPYTEVVQIKVPLDTILFNIAITVDSISILAFSGVPPGLTYACNPPTCIFPGGSNGCILVSGTPTVAGTYPITTVTSSKAHTTNGGFPLPAQIDTISYYSIVINQANGMANLSNVKFDVKQNEPNPVSTLSTIVFTVPTQEVVQFKVFNLIGKEIYRSNILAEAGKNSLKIDAADFVPGVYIYSLNNGLQTITKRMIVSKK